MMIVRHRGQQNGSRTQNTAHGMSIILVIITFVRSYTCVSILDSVRGLMVMVRHRAQHNASQTQNTAHSMPI